MVSNNDSTWSDSEYEEFQELVANISPVGNIAFRYCVSNGSKEKWEEATKKFLKAAAWRTPEVMKDTLLKGDLLRKTREHFAPLRANTFLYQPLPSPSHIRLLEIAPGSNSSTIKCDLVVVDLKDNPKYTALSYSWRSQPLLTMILRPPAIEPLNEAMEDAKAAFHGAWPKRGAKSKLLNASAHAEATENTAPQTQQPEKLREIICNGQKMRVWPNLFQALSHLRRDHPGRYWVDQLCINQDDEEEKGHQIQAMDRIFGSAQMVKVWLGSCFPYLSKDVRRLLELPLKRNFETNPECPELLAACAHLLSSSWFERLWVLQEAVVARDICFQFGEYCFGADILIKIIDWITYTADAGMKPSAETVVLPGLKMANAFFPTLYQNITLFPSLLSKRKDFLNGQKLSIFQWLEMSKVRNATNVEDYVYAGLGLIDENSRLIDPDIKETEHPPPLPPRPGLMSDAKIASSQPNWKIWPELRADIRGDLHTLFANLAACALSQPHGIDMLAYSQYHPGIQSADKKLSSIPSWIPAPRNCNTPTTLTQLGANSFRASYDFTNTAKISYDGTELHVDAGRLDTVKKVSGQMLGFYSRAFRILREKDQFIQHPDSQVLETLANVVVAGMAGVEGSQSHDNLRMFLICVTLDLRTLDELLERKEKDHKIQFAAEKAERDKKLQATKAKESADQRNKINQDIVKKIRHRKKEIGNIREAAKRLKESIDTLSAIFPDAPWPDTDYKPNDRDLILLNLYDDQFRAVAAARSVFLTERGLMGLGPSWVQEGDVVMLVKGARVPYLFVPFDEHLKRNITRLNKRAVALSKKQDKQASTAQNTIQYIKSEVKSNEDMLGRKDAWWLVGEAYLEGVMSGEAAYPHDFKRTTIV